MHKKAAVPACRPALRAGRQGPPETAAGGRAPPAAAFVAFGSRRFCKCGRKGGSILPCYAAAQSPLSPPDESARKALPALSDKYAPAAFCRGRVFAHTAEGQADEFRGLQNTLLIRIAVPGKSSAPPAFFWGSAFIPPQSQTRALRSVKPFYRIFGKRRH